MTLAIKFDDIQKGDIVRTTRVFEGGFTLTLQGKAERLTCGPIGNRGWYMDTHCVASENFGMKAKDIIELIERPQPKNWIVVGVKDDGSLDRSVASLDLMSETKAKIIVEEFNEFYKDSTSYCRDYKAFQLS